jgi:hypothetical protein
MNSTTGVLVTVSLIQFCTSLIWFAFGGKWSGWRHFIRKTERKQAAQEGRVDSSAVHAFGGGWTRGRRKHFFYASSRV